MSNVSAKRRILLTQDEFGLGDGNTFSIPWTIWAQLRSMFEKEWHVGFAAESLEEANAAKFAEWIILKHMNLAAVDDDNPDDFTTPQQVEALGWLTLLTLWGDDEGIAVAEFAEFLRGGAFAIEESK